MGHLFNFQGEKYETGGPESAIFYVGKKCVKVKNVLMEKITEKDKTYRAWIGNLKQGVQITTNPQNSKVKHNIM